MSITCDHYLRVYGARDKDEFLRLSLIIGSACEVHQNQPAGLDLHPCQESWFGRVIRSCSVTSQLENNEPVENECHLNADLTIRVGVYPELMRSPYYQNIFCAVCNSNPYPLHAYQCSFQQYIINCCLHMVLDSEGYTQTLAAARKILPFSLLLGSVSARHGLQQESGLKFNKCKTSEWPSPDGRCLDRRCSPGKYLDKGDCITAIDDIRGLGYIVRMFYIPKTNSSDKQLYNCQSKYYGNVSQFFNIFISHSRKQKIMDPAFSETELRVTLVSKEPLSNAVNERVDSDNFTVNQIIENVTECSQLPVLDFFFLLEAYFIANSSLSRDKFEDNALQPLLYNVLEMAEEDNSTLLLEPMFMLYVPDSPMSSDQLSDVKPDFAVVQTETVRNIRHFNSHIWYYKQEFLVMSPIINCVHVFFNKSEYTLSVNCTLFPPTWRIELRLGQTILVFSDFAELNMLALEAGQQPEDGHLKVCLDLLEKKIEALKRSRLLVGTEYSAVFWWLFYLTHICLGMSMLCLLATLFIYFFSAPLRSDAGMNNVFLCGALFLAQASLLLSCYAQGPGTLCLALGISTHFLWLSMISWSFICCFHMFRVFTAKTGIVKSTASSRKKSLVKKVAASVLMPAIIIATVILSAYSVSGGERIGYTDYSPCYLDSSFLVIISFAAPLGLVLLVNLFFFAATIHRIHKVKKLQTHKTFHKNDRKTFLIYVKLSTMTGGFWAVAIISEQLDNNPLRFISIVLNGLQGVFLFLSFMCNKRVLLTCFHTLSRDKRSTSTDATGSESNIKTIYRSSTFH